MVVWWSLGIFGADVESAHDHRQRRPGMVQEE